jgi:aconitate hydratase
VHHADGTRDALQLDHTYTASQLGWFRAGSALNVLTAPAAIENHPEP